MNVVLWILAVLLIAIGFIGIIVPVLPGLVFVFAGLLIAAWVDDFQRVGWLPISILGILTLLSFVADIVATGLGAKKAGASREAVIGAAIGTVIGLFFGISGIFAGPFLGAAVGEYRANRDLVKAGKVGYGTLFGLVIAVAMKIALALTMIGVFVTAYFMK